MLVFSFKFLLVLTTPAPRVTSDFRETWRRLVDITVLTIHDFDLFATCTLGAPRFRVHYRGKNSATDTTSTATTSPTFATVAILFVRDQNTSW